MSDIEFIRDSSNRLICGVCGGFLTAGAVSATLKNYTSPDGHNHDDNCLVREYFCQSDPSHRFKVSKQRTCPVCDWKGKETCRCHEAKKLASWPVEEYSS